MIEIDMEIELIETRCARPKAAVELRGTGIGTWHCMLRYSIADVTATVSSGPGQVAPDLARARLAHPSRPTG